MAASKDTQPVAGLLTAMAMIVRRLNATKLQFSPARAMRRLRPTRLDIILGSSMAIDGTVVNVALPAFVRVADNPLGIQRGHTSA